MDDRSSSSRRRVLKAGAAIGTGLAASMAGCTAAMPPLGQRIRYGRVDVPDPEPPTFEEWVPSPEEGDLSLPTNADYTVIYGTPSDLDRGEPADDVGRLFFKFGLDYFGVGYRDYDWILSTGHGTVVAAPFDREEVTRTIAASGYDRDGSYEEFEFFSRTDTPRVVGVGDGRILFEDEHRGVEVAHENLRALVDAREGRVPRYTEVDDGIDRMLETIGARPFSFLGGVPGGFEEAAEKRDLGLRTDASALQPAGGTTYFVMGALFEEGHAPSKSEFKDLLKGKDRALEADAVDVSIDGEVATAEIDPEPGQLQDSEFDRYPQITWGFELDGGTVTVRHEAGESLDAEKVALTPDGIEGSNEHPDIAQFPDVVDRVTPGTSVEVDASSVPNSDYGLDDSPTLYVVFDDETNPHVMGGYDL